MIFTLHWWSASDAGLLNTSLLVLDKYSTRVRGRMRHTCPWKTVSLSKSCLKCVPFPLQIPSLSVHLWSKCTRQFLCNWRLWKTGWCFNQISAGKVVVMSRQVYTQLGTSACYHSSPVFRLGHIFSKLSLSPFVTNSYPNTVHDHENKPLQRQ